MNLKVKYYIQSVQNHYLLLPNFDQVIFNERNKYYLPQNGIKRR